MDKLGVDIMESIFMNEHQINTILSSCKNGNILEDNVAL